MHASHETTYLQEVLALDPRTDAEAILRRRREFLQPPEVVLAELTEEDSADGDLRTRLLQRLGAVRQAFWRLDADELAERLSSLQRAAHAEIATAADRLRQVAAQREAILRLSTDPVLHPAFVKALREILIAPAAEANRLREREHRHMRPEQNEHYRSAWSAVQGTARVIRSRYPHVFALEEAWLTELIEYNPVEETADESANVRFGLAVLVGFVVTLAAIVGIVDWIFS